VAVRIQIGGGVSLVALATLIATVQVSALGGQGSRRSTLVVGVADAETGQPLEGAEVLLFREGSAISA